MHKTPRIAAGCLGEKRLCRLLRSVASHVNEKLLHATQSASEIFEQFLDGHRFDARLLCLFVHDDVVLVDKIDLDDGDQYSSGRRMVVTDRSHSVMIQSFSPLAVW